MAAGTDTLPDITRIVHSGGSQRGSRAGRFTAPEGRRSEWADCDVDLGDVARCERSREARSEHVPGHGQLCFLADVRGESAGPSPVIDT
jgi:hypothetical protein